MPLFIGNSEVEKVFIGETEVQTVRTEGDLRYTAFTNTPPQVSLSANASSYNSNVSATFTATVIDPDVPSLQTLTYVWTDNGTVVRTTTGTSSLTDAYTVSYSSGTRTIGVTVTDSGSGVSNNVTIQRIWYLNRSVSGNIISRRSFSQGVGNTNISATLTWSGGGTGTVCVGALGNPGMAPGTFSDSASTFMNPNSLSFNGPGCRGGVVSGNTIDDIGGTTQSVSGYRVVSISIPASGGYAAASDSVTYTWT